MAALNPGDIFAIETPGGTAYLQYTLRDPTMGPLIRVLPGLHEQVPDLGALAQRRESFWLFFPLGSAVRRRIVRRVATAAIPDRARSMPLMRSPGPIEDGRVVRWAIMNGGDIVRWVDRLDSEERDLSERSIWNDTLLVERLQSGWSPRDWS